MNNQQYLLSSSSSSHVIKYLRQDPVINKNRSLIYQKTLLLQLRFLDYDHNLIQSAKNQPVTFHIYIENQRKQRTKQILIEVVSENDPFFVFRHQCDFSRFQLINSRFKLCKGFQDFAMTLIRMFNKIEMQKKQQFLIRFIGVMTVVTKNKMSLEIIQLNNYRNYQFFQLDFFGQNQDLIEKMVSHKYFTLRKKNNLLNQRLTQITNIIKDKNPSILFQIQKVLQK